MKTAACLGCWVAIVMLGIGGEADTGKLQEQVVRELPRPALAGEISLEQAIAQRRSIRTFAQTPLTLEQISQLCWAGQGVTDRTSGFRGAPSAGALFPIELYVVGPEGVDHYRPADHKLERHLPGDLRETVRQAALKQRALAEAAVCLVITAVQERTARKYGGRAERYCFMEAGHVAQNVLLQATALHLGAVPIGAFHDDAVAEVLKLPPGHRVIYLLPIGNPK